MTDAAPSFELAKSGADPEPRFLQIAARSARKRKQKPEPKLTRVAFRVSRLMEFCTMKELQNQTGHSWHEWPLVVLKELTDNALDACEEIEIAPVLSITVKAGSIIIQDNGGGIGTSTIKSILDYTVRVSAREAYTAPTRGAQGNALKTILAMGYVLDRRRQDGPEAVGETVFETRGVAHRVQFRVDHINNEPRITHTTSPSTLTVGTRVTVRWPRVKLWEDLEDTLMEVARDDFINLVESYVWFNPHLSPAGPGAGKHSSTSRRRTRPGGNGAPAIRPARTGTTRRGCNATSPPTWPATATARKIARCASSSLSFVASLAPPNSVRSSQRSAARTCP